MEKTLESKSISELSKDGELPCVIIYSSSKHVDYIKVTLDFVKEFLKNKNFKIALLSDEARDFSRYLDDFVKISRDCVLGIVILDGFRPNVLFEFGVLVGLNKPIILLKEINATINIRTLFQDIDNENCSSITGLSMKQLDKIKNPKIDLGTSNHFSDLSTKVTPYNCKASREEKDHVIKQLNNCHINLINNIKNEYKKMLLENAPGFKTETDFKNYEEIIAEIVELYFGQPARFEDIENIDNRIEALKPNISGQLPSNICSIIASLYKSLPEEN